MSWQQIASGIATFTVIKRGSGALLFNETASDTDAFTDSPRDLPWQYNQNETLDTYVRSTGDGWQILVDGVL